MLIVDCMRASCGAVEEGCGPCHKAHRMFSVFGKIALQFVIVLGVEIGIDGT